MKRMTRIIPLIAITTFATPLLASQVVSVSDAGVSFAAAATSMATPYRAVNELERQADSVLRAARRVMDDGDYREAARLFEQIADRYPRTTQASDALYYRAYSLFRAGGSSSLSSALTALQELNRLYPSSAANKGDAGPLRIRICGELARRGDEACTREVVTTATETRSSTSTATTRSSTQGSSSQSCPDENDENDERIMAISALMNMNSEAAVPILERVLARKDDCSKGLRKKAVFLISQKRAADVVDILIKVAREDPSPDVREQAVFWLSNVRDPRVVDLLAEMAANGNDPAIQEKAIFSLSNTRSERASQILRDIAQKDGGRKGAREQAIFWLGNRRDAASVEFLRGLYSRLTDKDLKERVLFSVANQRGTDSGTWLIGIATDERESMELRKQALFHAGNQRAASLGDITALYDKVKDKEMKEQVIFVLSQNKAEASVDKLMAIARSDSDRDMRSKAIFWLGQSRDPRVVKFLEELINR